ncbi:tail fiber assembly protein [Budviciaceae bacterium CWB-B4]|uniref:Tail fiber assembly protein n=1 Tax=Limnobaculum xujianqingii TaxID=2738837 RepID=A0A9D7FTE5_9GAMM|nr:tail fiber assembly protein [Limnobaculum xujianqingii]MBK5073213.1 tail fiber assembly protein [Limnobaculum xujianqingii]MBK5176522.1 tail fiber assembly protein [Limnobaculum xujianqingii]
MFYYSKTTNAFYLADSKANYIAAGTWPDDAVDVSIDVFNEFSANPPESKMREPGRDGMPSWGDIPPLSMDELISIASDQKSRLLIIADRTINTLKDAVELDMATDEEAAMHTAWRKYRVLLSRVDVTKAPDIKWPKEPV